MHSRSCPARQRANSSSAFSAAVESERRLAAHYRRPAHLVPDAGWRSNWRNLRQMLAGADAEPARVYWAAAGAAAERCLAAPDSGGLFVMGVPRARLRTTESI